ncbi:class I SAM-dependent methyltransferase [Candidatus Nanohalococcus occultus]|uniref:AdoMet-dependent sugar methyltransferase n=1 Tax=Candidatus Nanohalococcus occultus TaxID=2978047 RepID=A0ABY8CDL8_9ARCH|nr:AdoMet-dependent sugar methyltransferase [Candidatus Nanohaloarchaeota archaeon SVXNc]
MTDSDLEEVTKYLSNPETSMGWISPLGIPESVQQLAGTGYKHTIGDKNYEPDGENYTVYDLCCGNGILSESLIQENKEKDGSNSLKIKGIDLAPPAYAHKVETGNEEFEVLQQSADDFLHSKQDSADLIYAIDAFQEFDDFETLANGITGSLKQDGILVFNSIYGLVDVFEDLEEKAPDDKNFVKPGENGRKQIHTDKVRIDDLGVEVPIVQQPRPYEDYRSELEKQGMEEVECGKIRADTSSIPEIAKSIGVDAQTMDDDINLLYDYGVMKMEDGVSS